MKLLNWCLNSLNFPHSHNKCGRNSSTLQKEHVKFLWMIVDCKLTWKDYSDHIIGKLTSANLAIRNLRNIASSSTLLMLYYSILYLHILCYGLTLWGPASETHVKKIEIMQRKVVSVITFSTYNSHTTAIFSHLKTLKLCDICEHQLGKFIFSIYNNITPENYFWQNNNLHWLII